MGLKATDFMGALPAAMGRMDKEDRGFALGLLPGLLYKESQKNKKRSPKDQTAQAAQAANVRVAEAASSGKKMKKGGKVSSSRKCSHNRLY
jgi:hypothetical protein